MTAMLVPAVAHAAVPEARGAATYYVRARAAAGSGAPSLAAQNFARALAAEPGNATLAAQALRQAITAGEWTLARTAAARLETARALPPEGLLWMLSDAVKRGDWRAARPITERLEAGGVFPFVLPIVRAWIAHGGGTRDPAALLGKAADASAKSYADEHRALLLLAAGRKSEGVAALTAVATGAGGRAMRLKLAGAARLGKLGEHKAALALLAGAEEPLAAGRALIRDRKPVPGAVDGAAEGIAELFARLTIDLQRERVTPLALSLARLATFLAPANSETWLVTAELLSADNQPAPALEALRRVDPADPFAGVARGLRGQLLVRGGDVAGALAEARVAAGRREATSNDLVRYADLLVEARRHAEAAPLYARAIGLRDREGAGTEVWLLHLLHGNALVEAGQWPQAKAALARAHAIAPAEPQVLNFLGYAQLERRENLDQAEALIREASRLAPDDASITDSLGWALFRRGKIAEAVATLERASAADPRQSAIGEHLGDAYWSAGRRVEARYAWSAALLHAEEAEAARLRVKLDTGFSAAVAAP